MTKKLLYGLLLTLGLGFTACSDDIDLVMPYPTNITFENLEIKDRFTHVVPDGGFSTDGLNFNTVKAADGQLAGGFCYSNRSMRSYVWNNDVQSIDSMRYSIFTAKPNDTGKYLVCHVSGDDAYFTLDRPKVISYMLVGNTTWAYYAMLHGDTYAGEEGKPVANPYVPSKPEGIWHSYVPGGVKKFADGDYLTLTAKGFNGGKETGTVQFDLACKKGHNTANPAWDYIVTNWWKMELSDLGTVDKVVFYLDSSDKNESQILTD